MQAVTLSLATAEHPLYSRLSKLGIPGNKTEQYKNFAIKPLLAKGYKLLETKQVEPQEADKIVIENGVVATVSKNVKVSFKDNFEADLEHYDALYYISHIIAKKTICFEIDGDGEFIIEHKISEQEALIDYRICITTKPNTQVQVFETFDVSEAKNSLLLYGTDAQISRDSTLRWIRDENMHKDGCTVIGTHHVDVAKQGVIELKTFDFGSGSALHLYKIDLANYAWADAEHLLLATQESKRGNVVVINHNEPYAKSVHNARSILRDKATGIFDGRIVVKHDAKYANAQQDSKAILLSDHAHMYAKPQLEIYTDELEASHGSTIGQLDEETLFYLRSRGISQNEAKKMLVLAFANVLMESVGKGEIFDTIHNHFEQAYYA